MGAKSRRAEPATVVVGRVVRPHGLRGEVVVEVLSDVEDRFGVGRELLVVTDRGRLATQIRTARPHKGRLLVAFEGIEDRDRAAALRGFDLEVLLEDVPPAPEGWYYHFELLESLCRDRRLGELGRVSDVLEDGGGLLLVVEVEDRRLLIPFVEDFLVRVDREQRLIELDLPEGLLETCVST